MSAEDQNQGRNNDDVVSPNDEDEQNSSGSVAPQGTQNQEFPYTGIFSPNGLLASAGEVNTQDSSVDPEGQVISSVSTDKNITVAQEDLGNMSLASIRKQMGLFPPTKCFPVRDIPPTEMAFSVDLIAEKIFSLLPTPDLLTCRSVSRRWNFNAMTQLQKRIELHFYGHNFSSSSSKSGQSLAELTELLQNPLDQEQQQHENIGYNHTNIFPCSRFIFTRTTSSNEPSGAINNRNRSTRSDQILQSFFAIHGVHIKEVTFSYAQNQPNPMNPLPREMVVMKQLKKIVEQLSNLRILSVHVQCQVEWRADDYEDEDEDEDFNDIAQAEIRGYNSPLRKTDPEFREIHSLYQGHSDSRLKVLNLRSTSSAKILEMLILLAPNLKEVILDEVNYDFFLEPLNRLHLLKKLWIKPDPTDESVQTLNRIATVALNEGNFHLREIYLCLSTNYKTNPDLEYKNKIVDLVNRILQCSAQSLVSLKWEGFGFGNEFKIPPIMRKLKKIEVVDQPGEAFNPDLDETLRSSLEKLNEKFPNLSGLRLRVGRGKILRLITFADSLKLEPSLSLKYLYLPKSEFREQLMPLECLQMIKKLFPNVHVYYI